MTQAAKRIERASALLSQAAGRLNLGLASKRLTRTSVREVAAWTNQAALILADAADTVPEVDGGVSHGLKKASGTSGAKAHERSRR